MALLALILAAVWRIAPDVTRGSLPDRASPEPLELAAAGTPVTPAAARAPAVRDHIERGAADAAAATTTRTQAAPPAPNECAALARWSHAALGYDALLCRAASGVLLLHPTAQFELHDSPGAFPRVALQGAAWLTQEGIAPATTRYIIPDRAGTPPCLTLNGLAAAQWLRRSAQPGIDPRLEWQRAVGALRRTDCPPPEVS